MTRMLKGSVVLFVLTVLTSYFQSGRKPADTSQQMVKIEGGIYTPFFETETGKRTAIVIKPFYIDAYPVTNAEFLAFVKERPEWTRAGVSKLFAEEGYLRHLSDDLDVDENFDQISSSPVTNVSWHAANAYCSCQGKRLPDVDEWEFAGQAEVTNTDRPVEDIILEWYSKPNAEVLPHVGTTSRTKSGVYDMHGLIWEWVADFNSVVMENDSRSNTSIDRELYCASGSFGAANKEDYATFMRYAFRSSLKSKYTVANLGFRCAKSSGKKSTNEP